MVNVRINGLHNERTSKATATRVLKAFGRDQRILSMMKKLDKGAGTTATEIAKISGEPWSYLKNGLRRMEKRGDVSKQIEIYNNRTRFRWYIK